jgi:hypothetical protein
MTADDERGSSGMARLTLELARRIDASAFDFARIVQGFRLSSTLT